jgi:hypothetical protein
LTRQFDVHILLVDGLHVRSAFDHNNIRTNSALFSSSTASFSFSTLLITRDKIAFCCS